LSCFFTVAPQTGGFGKMGGDDIYLSKVKHKAL
jgi:hypothetical protein